MENNRVRIIARKRTRFKRDWRGKEKLVARYIKRTRRISWRTRFVPEYRAIFNRASFTPTDQLIFYVNTAVTSFSRSFLLSFFLSRLNLELSRCFHPLETIETGRWPPDSFPSVLFTISRGRDFRLKLYFIDRVRYVMDRKSKLRVKLSDAI